MHDASFDRRRSVAVHIFKTQHGYSALIFAALKGDADSVRLLLEAGADKEATDDVRDFVGLTLKW